jgi:prepilin-type processing-associated H-X9-DG protein
MEQTALDSLVADSLRLDGYEANPQDNMDGVPWRNPGRGMIQEPLTKSIMICPSSGHDPMVTYSGTLGLQNLLKGNYVGCWSGSNWGDGAAFGGGAKGSGVFNLAQIKKWPSMQRLGIGKGTTIVGITDGTSNTVMLSEVLPFSQGLQGTNNDNPYGFNFDVRGAVIMPAAGGNMFTTFTAPNSTTRDRLISCEPGIPIDSPLKCDQPSSVQPTSADAANTWAAARSRHTGGVNAAFADGSVRFVRNSVDVTAWQAAGTKAGGEVFNLD